MLHFWDAHWDLRVKECPCDVHFLQWLEADGLRNGAIFHFGTGSHHVVGIETAVNGSNNAVLGITASPKEYDDYVKLCIERPEVSRTYKAYFGDIYQLDARLMPTFDVITAFHLGEFRSEKNDAYGGLTDLQVATTMVDCLRPGGRLLTYSGSYAYDVAERDVGKLVTAGRLAFVEKFETLMVFRKVA